MTELAAIALVLIAALGLRVIVSHVLRRLSIFPEDPDGTSGGFQDVVDWLKKRRGRS